MHHLLFDGLDPFKLSSKAIYISASSTSDKRMSQLRELPIIQKTYDLIKWYLPILNRLPKIHKFTLADRMTNKLYDLLENLIIARYAKNKLTRLESLNTQLDILRYQTRLLLDFKLIATHRYEYAIKVIDEIGMDLGGWIKQQSKQ